METSKLVMRSKLTSQTITCEMEEGRKEGRKERKKEERKKGRKQARKEARKEARKQGRKDGNDGKMVVKEGKNERTNEGSECSEGRK